MKRKGGILGAFEPILLLLIVLFILALFVVAGEVLFENPIFNR